ncbi:MAG: hypothetical protein HXY20_09155 [Acidobacteria bacterium]|nr:hypothetical protein [Acidobacteriota bacterium]
MRSNRSAVLILILVIAILPSALLAQQRIFARVEPNRDIAGQTASVYDPADGAFHPTAQEMRDGRENHTATLLSDGRVLIVGGDRGTSCLSVAEIFDPATGTFALAGGTMNAERRLHAATLLSDGKVLITGGDNGGSSLNTADIFDPNSGTFAATSGTMTVARSGHTATLLSDGKVLIAGGYDGTNYLSSAEIYDPSAGTFTATTGTMTVARRNHTATLLSDGKVLIAGGRSADSFLSTAEIYNPSTGAFTATAQAMTAGREGHTASLLTDGKVLITGGYNGSYLNTAEIYDVSGNRFTAVTRSMGSARRGHTATALSSGRVLIAGGTDGKNVLETSETYNPSDGSFSPSASLGVRRSNHTATLLPGNRVLLAGGLFMLPVVFDINSDQTDNVSPNIVFSADSRRGFVPYTGSGVVIEFSTETGAVLSRIATGGMPAASTLLTDGRTLAVVSALEGRVFLIDIDASKLAATYQFTGAQFGFGSNICLSPDGRTAYLSSTGSGEVIKFDPSNGRDLGRLKGLQAPTQITLSLDGATLMVVDTLSEELIFIDSASLTRKTALKAREKEPTADFTIFSRAVLAPDGLTGLIVSRDINGILGSDTAFVFKVATGEVLHAQKIGSDPGFVGVTPDGTNWVVLNDLSLSLIPTVNPGAAKDLSTVQGDPIGSANIVFSPDSVHAFYASSANDLVFQHNLVTDAVVGKMTTGDLPNNKLDQPSSLALTPDGKVLAVLNFVGNDLDLLTAATCLSGTKFLSSPQQVTGVSLVNLSERPAYFRMYALDNYGQLISGDGITNGVEIRLGANEQVSLTLQQIFNFGETERVGWFSIESSEKDVAGYLSIGNVRLTWLDFHYVQMDGFPMFRQPLYDWIVPEIPLSGTGSAELNLVNPYHNQSTYDSTRYAVQGASLETSTGNIAYPTNRQPSQVTSLEERPGAGLVLIAGGKSTGTTVVGTAETYDPASGSFSATTGAMTVARHSYADASLSDGRVLITGGEDSNGTLITAEAYTPSSGSFVATAGQMTTARARHTATLLSNGRVLLVGGQGAGSTNNTAETYDPASSTFSRTAGAMTASRESHTATLLINGAVLVTGGKDGSQTLSSAELYDPSRGLFTATGSLSVARAFHTATRLTDGTVLIVGGHDGSNYLDTAEIYDPAAGTFRTTAGKLSKARREHRATRLPDGRVLITGGVDSAGSVGSVEIYNPSTESFTTAGSLLTARRGHTATLMLNDKVLIAGGTDGTNPLNSAELYDPATGISASTGVMISLRNGHSATLLQSETAADGYLRMTSTQGLILTELASLGEALSALNGINMRDFSQVYRVYAPHFAETDEFRTILNIINGNSEEAEVTVTLHRPDGSVIGQPYRRVLAKNEELKRSLVSIFGNEPALHNATGWIEIESTKDLIAGTVSLSYGGGTALTTLQLSGKPLERIVFPVAAEDRTYQTGIALLNTGDAPATVTVELWGPGGTLDRSTTQTLTPRTNSALYLKDYFPGLEERIVGNIRIRSSAPLHALAILHDRSLNFMAAIPPTPLP